MLTKRIKLNFLFKLSLWIQISHYKPWVILIRLLRQDSVFKIWFNGYNVTIFRRTGPPFTFARAKSASASSDCLALTKLTWLGWLKGLHWEKLVQLGEWPYSCPTIKKGWPGWADHPHLAELIVFVNGSPSFVRKCRERWLAQRSSGSDPFDVSGETAHLPLPKQIFTLASHLKQNVGLGEG